VNGRKRHIVTDTLGLIVRVKVHRADLQDREAVPLVLEGMNEQFPRISLAWVDQGYTGIGKQWIEEQLKWRVEVVRHPPRPRGMWVFPGQEIDMTLFKRAVWLPRCPSAPLGRRTYFCLDVLLSPIMQRL
jgi:putative transposase